MPFERSPLFTGRESELEKLENMLFQSSHTTKIAIRGLGGVGKTQLAIELVYQVMEKYRNCSVFWIPATDSESLYQAYLAAARKLDIPGWAEQGADVIGLVQRYLSQETAGQWLLVFDNADDVEMWIGKSGSEQRSGGLLNCLPRSTQGSIIFTTRDRKIAVKLAQQNVVEVLELNKDAAKQLLRKRLVIPELTDDDTNAEALLEQLTYLPLAIVQASAYINANGISIADYVSLLQDQEDNIIDLLSEDFEDDERYNTIKNPVATTWLISFERIMQRDRLAAEYLSFMACVESKDIPLSLLPDGPSRKKKTDAIGTLDAYSFITRRSGNLSLDLHRLVHLATRNWLREKGLMTEWAAKAITRLRD